MWISPGSSSIKKDSIEKHISSEQHKLAADFTKKSLLGAVSYKDAVINDSPIGRGLKKMSQRDRDHLTTKFNCVYYLLKRERPFVDYPELLRLHLKNKGPDIGESYRNDRAAADFSQSIADTYHQGLVENMTKARYYSS